MIRAFWDPERPRSLGDPRSPPLTPSIPGCSGDSREVHQTLQDFLGAQRVQAPVTLYSDWLSVGHIDEFLSFVPAPDRKVGPRG